jgi:hypothetical protein
MDRRDFLSAALGAAISHAFPPPTDKPDYITDYLFQLSDHLQFDEFDEAIPMAHELKAAIEAEGIPSHWRETHRILTQALA